MTRYSILPLAIGGILILGSLNSVAADRTARKDNLVLTGTLVAEACTLWPDDMYVDIDFETVIDRYLYVNKRTPPKTFALHLKDCDTSLSKVVKITFTGNENLSLPGLLALDSSSEASGIAIGLETANGQPLPINQQSDYPLKDGDTVLNFQAYVEGEPGAIRDRNIGKGIFTSAATFNIDYQ